MVPQPVAGEDEVSLFRRAIKKNPEETLSEKKALQFFREFHGHDPDRVIRMEATIIEDGYYAKLGNLWGYDMEQFPIAGFNEVRPNLLAEGSGIKLCGGNIEQTESGLVAHQLFVFAGNQDLEWALKDVFGIASQAQFVDLGPIKNIWYVARKKQDNFKTRYYHHTFGEEENGAARRAARPFLMYDRAHKKQFIVGGNYTIPLEGISN